MEKEFIPYEQALALKELGFDEPCFGYYYTLNGKDWKFAEKSEYYRLDDEINIGSKFSLLSPTFSQAFRWFREKYNLWNMIYPRDGWNYSINRVDETTSCSGESFHSVEINEYEEVELECLKKLIEIVKEKFAKVKN